MGNIDYVWRWYWVDADGKVQHDKVHSKVPRSRMNSLSYPTSCASSIPCLQRTWIGDNDAGLSRRYANFSAQTGMVSNLRHFDAGVYRRLMALSHDFQQRGPMSDFLAGENGLKPAQLELMMKNTIDVARILEANCRSGKLRFDLNPMKFLKVSPRRNRWIAAVQGSDMNLTDICCPSCGLAPRVGLVYALFHALWDLR